MSHLTGRFADAIRSTSEFMEPIDLNPTDAAACATLTDTLRRYSLALVRSEFFQPNVRERFIDEMLDYLTEGLAIRDGAVVIEHDSRDLRPDAGFQYGPTPIGAEVALCSQPAAHAACKAFVERLQTPMYPFTIPGADYPDHKGRYMSHIVTRSAHDGGTDSDTSARRTLRSDPTMAALPDPANVVPAYLSNEEREAWRKLTLDFGMTMLEPVTVVSRMLASGLGLPADTFTRLMDDGHHKVAPTFASYWDDPEPGTVQAALHQDIDVFAIHAPGTHSGLYVYTETGERLEVHVPPGCYLVQAGRQLYLKMRSMVRSGEIDVPPIQPGWHEVVVTPDAVNKGSDSRARIKAILSDDDLRDHEKLARIRPLYRDCIRISCTFFYHFGDDTVLVYGLPEDTREEGTFPEGTRLPEYIGLELGFIKLTE